MNTKMLNKDSEIIFNACIYVFHLGVAESWEGVYFHIQVM